MVEEQEERMSRIKAARREDERESLRTAAVGSKARDKRERRTGEGEGRIRPIFQKLWVCIG